MGKTKPKSPERRRPLPSGPIQAVCPRSDWQGPGECPRPPELTTEAALRGEHAARRERLGVIADVGEIVSLAMDADDREAERQLRRWVLARFEAVEAADPSPASCKPMKVAAVPVAAWDPNRARTVMRARLSRKEPA